MKDFEGKIFVGFWNSKKAYCDPKLLKYIINTLIYVKGLNLGVISEVHVR